VSPTAKEALIFSQSQLKARQQRGKSFRLMSKFSLLPLRSQVAVIFAFWRSGFEEK